MIVKNMEIKIPMYDMQDANAREKFLFFIICVCIARIPLKRKRRRLLTFLLNL